MDIKIEVKLVEDELNRRCKSKIYTFYHLYENYYICLKYKNNHQYKHRFHFIKALSVCELAKEIRRSF